MSLVLKRLGYQYYLGKAFNNQDDDDEEDYSERRKYIMEDLRAAKNYMNKMASSPVITSDFVQKMIDYINASLEKEKNVYRIFGSKSNFQNLTLSASGRNKLKIQNLIQKLDNNCELMTKVLMKQLNGQEEDIYSYIIKLMNNNEFLSFITMKTETELSYTIYGGGSHTGEEKEKKRLSGKTEIDKAVSMAIGFNRKKRDYKSILKLMENDLKEIKKMKNVSDEVKAKYYLEEGEGNDSFEGWNRKYLIEIINESAKTLALDLETIDKDGKRSSGNSKKIFSAATREQKVKGVLKKIYKRLSDDFKIEGAAFLKNNDNIPALKIGTDLRETKFGYILRYLYEVEGGEMRQDIDYDSFMAEFVYNVFIPAVTDWINQMDKGDLQKKDNLIEQLNKQKDSLLSLFKRAYPCANKKNKNEVIKVVGQIQQFGKSNVSGLLGELGAATAFNTTTIAKQNSPEYTFIANVVGDEKNSLGQKAASDLKIKVLKNGKETFEFGIQVKNLTSKQNTKTDIYSTNVGLDSPTMLRYFSKKDLRVLKFFIANRDFYIGQNFSASKISIGDADSYKKIVEDFANIAIPSFMRMIDESNRGKLVDLKEQIRNNFYYINNKIYSAAAFLLRLLEPIITTFEQNKLIQVSGLNNIPQIIDTSRITISGYEPMRNSGQPSATKTVNGETFNKAMPLAIKSAKQKYPIPVDNLMSKVVIQYKGINIQL